MMKSLLPIGEYPYTPEEYSFNEAWKKLENSFREGEFVVCYAVSESEDEKFINLDYHGVRGKLYRGYLSQNRHLNIKYYIGKTKKRLVKWNLSRDT